MTRRRWYTVPCPPGRHRSVRGNARGTANGRDRWARKFHHVDPAAPRRGSRWILCGQDGRRYPLTLSMLLFGSSGAIGIRSGRADPALFAGAAPVR